MLPDAWASYFKGCVMVNGILSSFTFHKRFGFFRDIDELNIGKSSRYYFIIT
ncbi:hypothetical protein Cpin_2536 [Chitinophaga pinensis DSM 2588]|uniref:Uncharacterized protein n=1 Tax=Chitinophaga pinensis (strain ATCC 43595 / DSM 2588 / LMG 13176 / NBRC 15968 / NCIMB 11800 / UQM 2034) TaxID=485918 RepID=A0A979GVP2_CHIPD|nr:hypothetical protein Cpin_2536 [Chitinophaga pinensis DSM 2588]